MGESSLVAEVADRMYREAEMLDDGTLDDWLKTIDRDIRYVAPAREVLPPSKDPERLDRLNRQRWGQLEPGEERLHFWLYDEDYNSLTMRVRRLDTGLAYAELPESITSRMVTNVHVRKEPDEAGLLLASSKLLVHQVRHEDHENFMVARRWDKYRREGEDLFLVWRYVELGHPVLPRTISILF